MSLAKDKIKRLLWCDRHCCLCKKQCGIDIQFAHLSGREGSKDVNDMIPLCSECHTKIGAYNDKHKMGTRYKNEELVERREQVYEEFTRQLVPPVDFKIAGIILDDSKKSLKVIFHICNLGVLWVRASVLVDIFIDGKFVSNLNPQGHYSGKELWNLNPGFLSQGNFSIALKMNGLGRISFNISTKIIDQYERMHILSPAKWVYDITENKLWYEP